MRPVVFFDLDDTLFDHTWSMRQSIAALRDRFDGLGRMSAGAVEDVYVDALETLHLEVLAGRLSIEGARRARLARMLSESGDSTDAEAIDRAVAIQREAYERSRRAVPGSADVLRRVREHARVGIITNNLRDEQEDKLEICGLAHLVDDMVASSDLGISKPRPEIFEVAMRRFDVAPAQAAMVGDSWTSDVTGARTVGVRAVWFNRHVPPRVDTVDVVQLTGWEPPDEAAATILGLFGA